MSENSKYTGPIGVSKRKFKRIGSPQETKVGMANNRMPNIMMSIITNMGMSFGLAGCIVLRLIPIGK